MKRKLILTFLLLVALTVPITHAYPSDEWAIENAIAGVRAEHPKHKYTEFTGVTTSHWQVHPELDAPLHKHVTLTAMFGFGNSGYVRWEGRSYADGGIYTMFYSNHNPDSPALSTNVVYLGPTTYWDGSRYVSNYPQSVSNTGDSKVTVLVLGTNGLKKTYELGKNRTMLVYPPIGVRITVSILP